MKIVVGVEVDGVPISTQEVAEGAKYQVRLDFNPSELAKVTIIKSLSAALIQACDELGKDPRLSALAKTGGRRG